MDRRSLLAGGVAGSATLVAGSARSQVRPGVVVHTLLKALPGQKDRLGQFIALNWLVMDRAAIDAGLFTHAVLHAADAGEADFEFIVEVGYVDPGGYEAIADQFETIRRAHVTRPVDGLLLRDLGVIVGERRFTPQAWA